MEAIPGIIWLFASLWTARLMYQRWRPGIMERGWKGSSYDPPLTATSPYIRCAWAATFSLLIALTSWWIVLLVMGVMARPKKTADELAEERRATEREIDEMEAEAEKLRRALDKNVQEKSNDARPPS